MILLLEIVTMLLNVIPKRPTQETYRIHAKPFYKSIKPSTVHTL